MNENGGKKRREWVKNAAIIFLSVMLVLTFFSNTFMNYSLPEVAAQYVQSGTITAKIRGTGTVESGDPYNVKISETRTISSVLVKTGDKVEKGAPLLLLEDKESKELTDAQAALDKAMLDFELALLSGDISNSTFQNVQNGNVASINTYQSRIVAAEAEIAIEPVVGPEFVTGSTRMKSGTAQKMVLNMITTSTMIKLGRVKGNRMVNMQLTNQKLVDRGTRMIMEELRLDYEQSKNLLLLHGSVREAIDSYHREWRLNQ